MLMFTLVIHLLFDHFQFTIFMDLTFQVPMQYFSLQHQTLLPSPVTSTAGRCFHFSYISSFFLKLFLHSCAVAYWASTNRGSSFFSVLSFCLFILFMGFSRQENWSGLPFLSPVEHVLSECTKNYGWRFVTLYRRWFQNHPQEKWVQKGKMIV